MKHGQHESQSQSCCWDKNTKHTHDGRHVVALVGGRHQRPEVGLTAHAHRGTLLLHVLVNSSWRQQPGGGAVVRVAGVSCRFKCSVQSSFMFVVLNRILDVWLHLLMFDGVTSWRWSSSLW